MPWGAIRDIELAGCIGAVKAVEAKRIEIEEPGGGLKESELRRIECTDTVVIFLTPRKAPQTFDNSRRVKANSSQGSN